MRESIGWLIIVLLLINISVTDKKSYWKNRYKDSQTWADTLYEENLRLADTINKIKNDNYLLKQHLLAIKDTSSTIVKISR